jgi:hypothetical protein
MKRLWAILLAVLLTAAVVAPASAWELGLEGQWLWGYDYVDQGGASGFFGPYNYANPAIMGAGANKWNSMNAWVGARRINVTGTTHTVDGLGAIPGSYGLVTGADAALQWSRAELVPEIRINKAVRLRGAYQIGAGTATYGLYPNSSSFGTWNPIASGTWTQFWVTAQTPYGILIAGKRPFAWGIGVQYEGTSCTSESIGFIAPYGPLRIGWLIYPWRQASWINSLGNYQIISSIGGQPELGMIPRVWDKQAIRELYPGAFVTYDAGQVSTGILAAYHWINATPNQAQLVGVLNGGTGATSQDQTRRTFSAAYEEFSAFFKYNNGRFFLNMELARFAMNQHTQMSQAEWGTDQPQEVGAPAGAPRKYAPLYGEGWKWAVELGAMSGPAKASFFWSWVPGPDRRRGVWINHQSWENVANGTFLGNTQLFLPYSLLMSYQYGAGLNACNTNGEGYMTDANSYGARLDYAVAANLNLYGSFFYADRVSGGWPIGILTPVADATNGGGRALLLGQLAFSAGNALGAPAPQNSWTTGAPNIPDNSLGWEVTLGADWKLLEGLTLRMRGAYWEPGAWFKWACVDKSLASGVLTSNTGATAATALTYINPVSTAAGAYTALNSGGAFGTWAINPNKSIDPIWMFQGVMVVDF